MHAVLLLILLLPGFPSLAQTNPVPAHSISPLVLEVGAGPVIGLDRPLRGGALEASLLFDLGCAFGRGFSGLQTGVQGTVLYDRSYEACILGADLVLCLGRELRLQLGCELPPGGAALRVGDSRLRLLPAAMPNHYAISTVLAEPWEASPGRARCTVDAAFGWSAYSLADASEASRSLVAASGIGGFASGFRLDLCLRLQWGGGR